MAEIWHLRCLLTDWCKTRNPRVFRDEKNDSGIGFPEKSVLFKMAAVKMAASSGKWIFRLHIVGFACNLVSGGIPALEERIFHWISKILTNSKMAAGKWREISFTAVYRWICMKFDILAGFGWIKRNLSLDS